MSGVNQARLEPGTILAGKYRVDRELGRGGMGVVVAATHLDLHTPVALKFLLPEYLGEEVLVGRFLREARASAQLRGEHVCRASDVGRLENGAPYIVMELLEGESLASRIQRGPLTATQASDYVAQACVGLAEAHARGMVHRDLKPENLFLAMRPDRTAIIKVLDFGIAKAPVEGNVTLTRTSMVMGTPVYMSPEQFRGARDADARSDIWALGTILYELVSGRRPFVGDSAESLAMSVGMDPVPPLAVASPPGFAAVIERCLAKDPAARYQDVAALAHALARFGGPPTRALADAAARLLAAPALPHDNAPGPRRPRWPIFAGVGAVVLGAGVVLALGHSSSNRAKEPDAAPIAVVVAVADAASPDAPMPDAPSPDAASADAPSPDAASVDAPTLDAPRATPPALDERELTRRREKAGQDARDKEVAQKTTAAPPSTCGDAEDTIKKAEQEFSSGFATKALATLETALQCKSDIRLLRTAALYSCRSKNVASSRRYYAKIDDKFRSAMLNACQQEGITLP